MDARNEWEKNIPEDCKKAIGELRRLKVYRLAAVDDCVDSFADEWWMVLHEVDLYVEGEFTEEDGGMNKAQAKRADKWLVDHLDLFNKYKDESDGFSSDKFHYYGQV